MILGWLLWFNQVNILNMAPWNMQWCGCWRALLETNCTVHSQRRKLAKFQVDYNIISHYQRHFGFIFIQCKKGDMYHSDDFHRKWRPKWGVREKSEKQGQNLNVSMLVLDVYTFPLKFPIQVTKNTWSFDSFADIIMSNVIYYAGVKCESLE